MRNPSRTLALLAIALGTGAVALAQTGPNGAAPTSTPESTPGATLAAAADTIDLTGEWQLDPKRSDAPPSWGGGRGEGRRGRFGGGEGMGGRGGGGFGGGGFGGGGFGRGGYGGRRGGEGGASAREEGRERGPRPARLPARIHVTQTSQIVSFEDSTGTVIEEVATVPAAADTFSRAPGAVHVLGTWNGKSLEMDRQGPGGSKVAETWSLADAGASLVSVVRIEGGEMPARTMRRVYRRVSAP
jgi:hypothetical protein